MEEFLLQNQFRCQLCRKLLYRGEVINGQVEIKCPRCGKLSTVKGWRENQNIDSCFILTDQSGKILRYDKSVDEIFNLTSQNLLAENIENIFCDKFQIEKDHNLFLNCKAKKYLRADFLSQNKRKQKIPFSILYKFYGQNRMAGELFLRVIRKINNNSPKKVTERTSFSSKNFCDFICEFDLKGTILYLNNAAENIFGGRVEKSIGKSIFDYFDPKEAAWRKNNFRRLVPHAKSFCAPYFKIRHKQSGWVEFMAYCTPMFDNLGELVAYKALCWIKNKPGPQDKLLTNNLNLIKYKIQ